MSFRQNFIHKNKRKKNAADDDNTAWLVSFADLLSLMLTFFVLLFSLAEIPQKKWTEYSSAIIQYITGNKVNIFNSEINVTNKSEIKKISTKRLPNITYINTLLDGMKIDGKPASEYVNYEVSNNKAVLSFEKGLLQEDGEEIVLTDSGINLFLSLSKIFQTIKNQLIVIYPEKDYLRSADFSNFIARKIEEFGYEYKVLRGVYYYNKDLSRSDIPNNFQIVIKNNEAVF